MKKSLLVLLLVGAVLACGGCATTGEGGFAKTWYGEKNYNLKQALKVQDYSFVGWTSEQVNAKFGEPTKFYQSYDGNYRATYTYSTYFGTMYLTFLNNQVTRISYY